MSLAGNWRTMLLPTGDGAVNKYACYRSGSDLNAGTKAAPKKNFTISYITDAYVQIRAGYYKLTELIRASVIYLDGLCIIDASDVITPNATAMLQVYGSKDCLGSELRNFYSLHTSYANINFIAENVKLYNCSFGQSINSNTYLRRCLAVDCTATFLSVGSTFRTTFIGGRYSNITSNQIRCFFSATTINNSYMNASHSYISSAFETGFSLNGSDFKNLTLDGDGDTIGNTYSDGQKFSGTLSNGTGTITITECFWTDDMGFNDAANGDYTLKVSPQSPLFNESNVIGCYDIALKFDANHSAFDPANSGVSYSNVTRTTGATPAFTLTTTGQGTVVSTDDPNFCIDLFEETNLNRVIELIHSFNYYNGDWVDKANYDAGVNDEVRLTYRFQIYDENEPNGADNILNWSDWYELELFTPFEVDSSDRGNGDVDCTLTSLGTKTGRRFRIEFTLRDNGV